MDGKEGTWRRRGTRPSLLEADARSGCLVRLLAVIVVVVVAAAVFLLSATVAAAAVAVDGSGCSCVVIHLLIVIASRVCGGWNGGGFGPYDSSRTIKNSLAVRGSKPTPPRTMAPAGA